MNTAFTRCINCAHAAEVMEMDRFGVKRPSMDVAHCAIFQQLRCVRFIRSCREFAQRKQTGEAA